MDDRLSFDGRVAVITGAGRGLGRAYALEIARRGGHVLVNDLGSASTGDGSSTSPADEVAAEIGRQGGQAVANYDSVAEPSSAPRIVEAALDAFGTVDIVINNAGSTIVSPFDELTIEQFRSVIDCHLIGSAAVTHAAWPIMRAKAFGRVVMTVSSAGLFGIENIAPYCAAKAGVFGLTKALALEGAHHGIAVNAVSPGAKTRLSESLFGQGSAWTWRPELVAPLVVYLASQGCRHNGRIFSAMGGRFGRTEAVETPGVVLDPRREWTAEDIQVRLDEIDDLVGAAPQDHGLAIPAGGRSG